MYSGLFDLVRHQPPASLLRIFVRS